MTVLLAASLIGAGPLVGGKTTQAEEPMTVPEVVEELTELTTKVTPFTVTYDADGKWLIFREELEISKRIGELRVRLDRVDRTRMNYSVLEPGLIPIIFKGKPIAGQANFYCLSEQKCIARDLHDPGVPATFVDSAEQTFGIDVFNDVRVGELRRFADLIGHLIVVSSGK